MRTSISVIVPSFNAGHHLARCLNALQSGTVQAHETIVVDDGSTDDTREIALFHSATVIRTGRRMGPAHARNLGARGATGDLVLFIDSDVLVASSTLEVFGDRFDQDPELDALIGSYDAEPYCWSFLSQYRNLMHTFVHQTGLAHASTFWSGCGAIRTKVLLEHGGFDETYARPAIEDIELGYRMVRAGRKIALDRSIQVKHLKCWTLKSLLRTDILDRGIPWTRLILRDRFMPNDLNLRVSQRASVVLVYILAGLMAKTAVQYTAALMFPLFAIVLWMLARWWGELLYYSKPRRAYMLLVGLLTVIAGFAYHYKLYGLIIPLLITPVLLMARHRYRKIDAIQDWHRKVAMLYIIGSLAVAAAYIPTGRLLYASVGIIIVLGMLNIDFYLFLFRNRGIAFLLSAIPFHFLYHFYNGVSFLVGAAKHLLSSSAQGFFRGKSHPSS